MAQAPAPARHKLVTLEIGRFLAATSVVLSHYSELLFNFRGKHAFSGIFIGMGGYIGVNYFFVLSGFIIYYIHERDLGHPDRLGGFVVKRSIRVLPMFWMVSVLMLISFLLVPALAGARNLSPPSVAMDLLLLPHGDNILPVSWTLRHEVVFYALFALAICLGRWALWAIVVWALGGLAWAAYSLLTHQFALTEHNVGFLSVVFGAVNLGFVLGIGAAQRLRKPDRTHPALLIAAGLAILLGLVILEQRIGASVMSDNQLIGMPIVVGHLICSTLLIYGFVRLEERGWDISFAGTWKVLGGASYLIYLLHQPIGSLAIRLAKPLDEVPADLIFVLLVIFVLVVAVAVHVTVERPLLRWLAEIFGVRGRADAGGFGRRRAGSQ